MHNRQMIPWMFGREQAIAWYNKYLAVAKPGTKGYEFATERIAYLKGELFMEETD